MRGRPLEPFIPLTARVVSARARQQDRAGKVNAWLGNREVEATCSLGVEDQALLERAVDRLGLSARAYHRVLKVARTIADLDHAEVIGTAHLAEALGYRCLDRRPAAEQAA